MANRPELLKPNAVANPAKRAGMGPNQSQFDRYYSMGDEQDDVNSQDSLAGDPSPAEDLNARIKQVIDMIKGIEEDAKAAGIYNDRSSISALRALASDASAINERWMETGEIGEAEYQHKPGQVVEVVPPSGFIPEGKDGFNQFGGQIFKVDEEGNTKSRK